MYKKELTGMRFIFVSQVLRLITEVFVVSSFIFNYVSGATIETILQDVAGNIKSFMIIMALDSMMFFFSLVSTIIYAIGIIMLSRYERNFMPAIFTLFIGYATAFVTYLPIGDMLSDVIPVFSDVMLMVTTLTVMEGIMRIAYRINDEKLYSFGDLLVKISAAGYVVNMLCSICTLIFSSTYNSYDTVATVFSAASIIIELAIYIMFFILILRTMKSLKTYINNTQSISSEPEAVGSDETAAETASA